MKHKAIIFSIATIVYALTTTPAQALNRLQIRPTAIGDEFYDSVTGQSILLRGNNYIRYYPGHDYNFDTDVYDRARHEAALKEMKSYGYNSVRVILAANGLASKTSQTINPQFVTNFVDFLKMAEQNDIYVLPVTGFVLGKYLFDIPAHPNFHSDPKTSYITFNNIILRKEFVDAKAKFMKDVLTELKRQNAPLHVIVGWHIENEIYFDKGYKPLSLTSGLVTGANGTVYNMAIANDKLRMIDENTAYYIKTVRNAMRSVDSQALVSVSYFSPGYSGSDKIVRPGYTYNSTEIDFFSLHLYPDDNHSVNDLVPTFSLGTGKKAIIVSEYGAYPIYFSTLQLAATGMRNLQTITCSQGRFKGWFYYDYDTYEMEPTFTIYQTTEGLNKTRDIGNAPINKVLAPIYRADPCKAENTPGIVGGLDGITSSGLAHGWVADPHSKSVQVNLYLDGPNPATGKVVGTVFTSQATPLVTSLYPWSFNTGFRFQIPQEYLIDNQEHTLYAQAVDTVPFAAATSYQLPKSGMTIPKLDSIPGDLVENGDTPADQVNAFDYNALLVGFGTKYSIFDYNAVISNFGK